MRTVLFLMIFGLGALAANAQEQLKGIVLEYKSNEAMQEVSVKNLNSGDSALTNKSGEFSIAVHQNDILSFSAFGYRVDSLVVTDFAVKRVYLSGIADPRVLETVHVMTNSRLREEMEELKKEAQYANTVSGGGIGLSPSRIFGKGARNARRQYKILAEESDNRLVDVRFSTKLVQSLTPLKGEDLNIFMAAYRPKVSFIKEANDERLRVYVMDSYNAYKDLDSDEKEKLRLKNESEN